MQDLSVFLDTETLCVRWGSTQIYQDRSVDLLCEWLSQLPHLKKLELENYRVHGHCNLFCTLASHCQNLESLALQASGARLGRIRAAEERLAWGRMLKLPRLKELSLFGLHFANGDLLDLLQDTSLEVLTFWRCRVHRESDNFLKILARCETLKTLQLHYFDQRPVQLILPSNATSLHLSCMALSSETCKSIADHDNLRHIRLNGCSFFDDYLPFNPKWKSYGLYHTNIKVLPSLSGAALYTLELVDCNLDDLKLDVSYLPAGLTCLNLSDNIGLSTKALTKLMSTCNKLRTLYISGMHVDIAGLSAAVAAHYMLDEIITDEEIPSNLKTYLRLNEAGRGYLQNDQASLIMSAKVLGKVSCHLDDIYTHLLETPSICTVHHKR
jgi:hypothetical protein